MGRGRGARPASARTGVSPGRAARPRRQAPFPPYPSALCINRQPERRDAAARGNRSPHEAVSPDAARACARAGAHPYGGATVFLDLTAADVLAEKTLDVHAHGDHVHFTLDD